jgi:hypothetical protein
MASRKAWLINTYVTDMMRYLKVLDLEKEGRV